MPGTSPLALGGRGGSVNGSKKTAGGGPAARKEYMDARGDVGLPATQEWWANCPSRCAEARCWDPTPGGRGRNMPVEMSAKSKLFCRETRIYPSPPIACVNVLQHVSECMGALLTRPPTSNADHGKRVTNCCCVCTQSSRNHPLCALYWLRQGS